MLALPVHVAERMIAQRRDELLSRQRERAARKHAALLRARVPNRVPRRWRRRYL